MKQLTLGILAHVDAGKTTLSEALLFTAGAIRKAGRVDKKDAFLDNYELERERGITIFSKQAVFSYEDLRITLLDTPGHVDFSTEMERTLQVLDAAVLLISAADGVQSHTRTLWKLLESYQVPVFLFVNKMDQPGADQEKILAGIQNQLSGNCVDFTPLVGAAATESKGAALEADMQEAMEAVAICDEELLNSFLTDGRISQGQLREKIAERKVFPCLFGSALRLQGIEALVTAIAANAPEETKSTPIFPMRGSRSSVMPPEASSFARPATSFTASAIISSDILSSMMYSAPASTASRTSSRLSASTSISSSGYFARARPTERAMPPAPSIAASSR